MPATLRVLRAPLLAMVLALAGVPAAAAAEPAPERVTSGAEVAATRWALVLSGGMARGFGHGGIIRALEEARTRPDLVIGTSMGGIVAAMYAAGYTPDSLRAIVRAVPWDMLFGGAQDAYQWRSISPRAWLEFVTGTGRGPGLPPAIVDNTVINQVLIELFLNADAAAQGDFDRLPIPFRAVGTDVRTGRWHMIGSGSLARACRVTAGVPLMFPPVADGDALLVDGGMSSNLPIGPARAAGAGRVLAVDVASRESDLDENSSGLEVFLQLWDVVNKRGQADTISAVAGDTLLWLKLHGAAASDFASGVRIMDQGYREGGEAARAWALGSGLPRTERPLETPSPVMAPLAGEVLWSGRRPVRRAAVARRVLGRLPEGEFRPMALVPALRRLARSGIFESAWPTLAHRGDSTVLSFEVRERPVFQVGPAFRFDNDEGTSVHVGSSWRPPLGPFPAFVRAGWALRPLGWGVHGSFEPRTLDYGSTGVFLRGRYQETRTRIFEAAAIARHLRTHRFELLAGAQAQLSDLQVVQAGVGALRISRPGPGWDGPLLAVRSRSLDSGERSLDAEWVLGAGGYSRFEAAVDFDLRVRSFVLTPGLRFGAVEGDAPPDVLVGLGGPHSFSGLRRDEWLGRRVVAGSLEFALEAGRQARVYLAGQAGAVSDAVSAADLGSGVVGAGALGAEVQLPIGPLRAEWGATGGGRQRFDIQLGTRF